jgi:hypothetical protein
VWFVDTEFQHPDGERDQRPICLVAKELYSGRVIRMWEEDLRRETRPPFDVGERSIVVAYGAFAELGTFSALNWPWPKRLLDLHPEFRCQDNDAPKKSGSLLAALTKFDLPHMSVMDKEANRKLFIEQSSWNKVEKRRGTRYCETDVDGTISLWPELLPGIENIDEAFLRSEYVAALADVTRNGIMMDVPVVRFMQNNWHPIKEHLTAKAHRKYGVFPEGKWSNDAAEQYLEENHMLDACRPPKRLVVPPSTKRLSKRCVGSTPSLTFCGKRRGQSAKFARWISTSAAMVVVAVRSMRSARSPAAMPRADSRSLPRSGRVPSSAPSPAGPLLISTFAARSLPSRPPTRGIAPCGAPTRAGIST